jgi:uroporphyrin-III C-methyltransferase
MTVFLVGAGPGDPGLITVRGLELVRACDVLVYDRLVSPELVDEIPPHARAVSRHDLDQHEVNELLVSYGRRAHLAVVRLKGGDPFVFGRGGEEALALADAGIPFEVVPGISALSAVPAAAGIPVTHRGVASQVTLVSGRNCDGSVGFDPAVLAAAPGTLVLFMSLGSLPDIVAALLDHGKDPWTPAAAIAHGTRAEQRTVRAALAELPAAAAELDAPTLIVIGDVVASGWPEQLAGVPAVHAAETEA